MFVWFEWRWTAFKIDEVKNESRKNIQKIYVLLFPIWPNSIAYYAYTLNCLFCSFIIIRFWFSFFCVCVVCSLFSAVVCSRTFCFFLILLHFQRFFVVVYYAYRVAFKLYRLLFFHFTHFDKITNNNQKGIYYILLIKMCLGVWKRQWLLWWWFECVFCYLWMRLEVAWSALYFRIEKFFTKDKRTTTIFKTAKKWQKRTAYQIQYVRSSVELPDEFIQQKFLCWFYCWLACMYFALL